MRKGDVYSVFALLLRRAAVPGRKKRARPYRSPIDGADFYCDDFER